MRLAYICGGRTGASGGEATAHGGAAVEQRLRGLTDGQLRILIRLARELSGQSEFELAQTLRLLRWLESLSPMEYLVLRVMLEELEG